MIDAEAVYPPAEREWMGWPTDIQQRALAVIATTRYEWASRPAAGERASE
jgi:hypothetical protein